MKTNNNNKNNNNNNINNNNNNNNTDNDNIKNVYLITFHSISSFPTSNKISTGNPEDLRLKTESFVPHLLVREGSSGRLSCQYLNSMSTEWYFNDTRISGISGKWV